MNRPILDMLEQGGMYIHNCFLIPEDFLTLQEKFMEYEFEADYQPHSEYYGNRLQAYPVYETDELEKIDNDLYNKLKDRIKEIVGDEITEFSARLRYVDMNEIKESMQNQKYGIRHTDGKHCAGVLYFEQALDGGTAIYRNQFDQKPDTEVAAYPNRAVIYNGQQWHAPCNDFTYEKRKIICFFFNVDLDKY